LLLSHRQRLLAERDGFLGHLGGEVGLSQVNPGLNPDLEHLEAVRREERFLALRQRPLEERQG
jgi:hypothetical protein